MGLTSRIPHALSNARGVANNTYVDSGVNFDVAIAGLPFMLATDPNNPLIRRTAQYRKQQVDQSQEPGEQSIVQWWVESQSSFHLGAGQKYMDTPAPGNFNQDIRKLRAQTSTGVNPWTLGQVTLLNQTTLAYSSSTATLLTADADGTATRFLVAAGSTLTRITETVSGGTPTYTSASVTWGGSGTILALATDGTYYYACDSTGLYRGKLTGSSPGSGTKQYAMPSGTSSVVLGWVKSRLMALVNVGGGSPTASAYELLSTPVSPPAAFPTAVYTHPNTDWLWTSVAEGPSAIYAAGYAGNHSEILKFVLDTTGAMPTLVGGTNVAVFPPGERVLGMRGYLGAVLGVSTSRGFHVGTFTAGSNGEVAMGPTSLENVTLSGGVAGDDRFFLAAGQHDDGTAGLFRIDTSQQLSIKQFSYTPDLRFGWASDARAADDSEVDVAGTAGALGVTVDGRMAFLVPGFGLYVEHPSRLRPTGTLQTSRIRFGTLDPKLFRFVRVRGEGTGGTISVSTSLTDTGGQTAGVLNVASGNDSGDLATNQASATWATIGVTLTRDGSDATLGPTFTGYQMKSLWAGKRQRELVLPLAIYDKVLDSSRQPVGGDGVALANIRAIEALEGTGDIVTLQHLGAFPDQQIVEFIVIDNFEFRQVVDPTDKQNWGGVGIITGRTIA